MMVAERGMSNSDEEFYKWCRKLVPEMRWSMSEGAVNDFERWLWFDKSDIRWKACVVTMRRLNGYKIIEIWWLSGIKNFVSERNDLYSIRSETLRQWRDFRIGVMCWNFGAWTTVRARAFWMCWNVFRRFSNKAIGRFEMEFVLTFWDHIYTVCCSFRRISLPTWQNCKIEWIKRSRSLPAFATSQSMSQSCG